MKFFYTCFKHQLNFNNIVTACEFLYPETLTKFAAGNKTRHFNAWKSISTLSCVVFKNGFSGEGLLKIVRAFEKQYCVTNATLLNVNYSSIEELNTLCIENNYAIISENDFYYPKNDKMVSINGNEISGEIFLLGQVK